MSLDRLMSRERLLGTAVANIELAISEMPPYDPVKLLRITRVVVVEYEKMTSIFSQLPNELIMKIIKINTDREIEENRSKYNIIVKRLESHFRLCEEIDPERAMVRSFGRLPVVCA